MSAIDFSHFKGNSGNIGYALLDNEWYAEPPWCVRKLFDVEQFYGPVWDPCCGLGTIPRIAKERGYSAYGTDIDSLGWPWPFSVNPVNFLDLKPGAFSPEANIVTNPPFKDIELYIRQALLFADNKVCVLARLALMEGKARAAGLWRDTPIARVHVLASRVGCPPERLAVAMTDEQRDKQQGKVAYAWFVWDRSHVGLPTWDVLS